MIIVVVVAVAAATSGCDSQPTKPAMPAAEPAASVVAGLTRIEDVSQVCMVNDQYMGTAQIPVAVEGRTYFGCCEMCKGRLASEPETRQAKDPVTGETVDKATAVIAREAGGKVHYFASAESLARYRGTP